MLVYSVEGYLDDNARLIMNNIWTNLSAENITNYGFDKGGKIPHITIANYEGLNKDIFIVLLDKFYSDKESVPLLLDKLGTFIETGVLYLAPTLSIELLKFHNEHHNHFINYKKNPNCFYISGRWSPHCTIASGLNDEKLAKAFVYCQNNINKISCSICEIGLVEARLDNDGIVLERNMIFAKKLI